MFIEMHVLVPRKADEPFQNSDNWIGVLNKKLFVKTPPFSIRRIDIPSNEFAEYWLPPEMAMKKPQPFQALITFDDEGEIVAIGYPLGELTWGEAIEVMPMTGALNKPRLRDVVSVAMSITDVRPTGKCVLTFPVVDHQSEKLFALSDGWFVDAIPALDEFARRKYLAGPPGSKERWKSSFHNLTVIRAGKIIAYGRVNIMRDTVTMYLNGGEFMKGEQPLITAENFNMGDKLRVRFSWHGQFPVIESLLREATIDGVENSEVVGRRYTHNELMTIMRDDLLKSSEHVLPEIFKTKVIRLKKK